MSINKLRILCLHGYTQNGILFSKKTSVVRKSVENLADFVYVTAPHHIADPSYTTATEREAAEKEEISEEHAMHGWWFAPGYKPVQPDGYFVGYKESVQYIKEVLKQQGPFDGILGFSQGGAFAALLTEMMENEQTPFKFSIIVAGFKPTMQVATNWMLTKEKKIKTPSLHFIGDLDTFVLPDKMNALLEAFEKPKIFRHTGGHYLPSSPASRRELKVFLTNILEQNGTTNSHTRL